MGERIVLVDSPEIAARGGTLFPGSTVLVANGSLPPEAAGCPDCVAISPDRARIDFLCCAAIESGCKLVRSWECDLTDFTTRQQILDSASAIKAYVPNPDPQAATQANVAPPFRAPEPARAGPSSERGFVVNNSGVFDNSKNIELSGVFSGESQLSTSSTTPRSDLDSEHISALESDNVEVTTRADGAKNHVPHSQQVRTHNEFVHSPNTSTTDTGAGIDLPMPSISGGLPASAPAILSDSGPGNELLATGHAKDGLEAHNSPIIHSEPPAWHSEVPAEAEVLTQPFKPSRKRPRLASIDGNLARAPDPDDEPMPAELSEDALSEHFAATRGNFWRYVPEWGMWLEWRGDGWHRDTLHKVAHECKEITREALYWRVKDALSVDGKRKLSSKRMAWNVRDMAATHPKISILAAQLDADPWLLGVPGGVVDLKNGKLLEAEPDQYITRRCSVAPEDGSHPLFDKVFERACSGHDGMREYLMRWFGYMLTGDVREEAFMFLYGPGGSGKSTLIKCLTDILGDYAVSISMDALMEQKNPRHTQEIAKLAGMRLIYASETSEGRLWNEALVKDLTGRDTITARFMRGNDFNFKICGKLLLYGNAMPRLKSVGEEIRRRIHLVEYGASLAEDQRDSSLKDRLVDEYPMILNSLIRGCVDWQDCRGLGKPESVTVSVDAYLEGEDSFALFIDECVQKDVQAREQSGEVYRRYRSWASAAGEYTMSQKRFVQTLRLRGFDTIRSTQGRMIAGLKLLAAPVEDQRPHWQQD